MTDMQLEDWTLTIDELNFLANQREDVRFELAIGLRHLGATGLYPKTYAHFADDVLEYLSQQIFRPISDLLSTEWSSRRIRRRREAVCSFLNLKRATPEDLDQLKEWLQQEFHGRWPTQQQALELSGRWLASRNIFAPTDAELDRLVRAQHRAFEEAYLDRIASNIDPATKRTLDESLSFPDGITGFASIKAAPGKAAMSAFRDFTGRLKFVRGLGLPSEAIQSGGEKLQELIRRRVLHEDAWEMRRRPETRRIGMYAIYLHERRRELTDTLVELLIETVHQVVSRSERRVAAQFLSDIKRIAGKEALLADIAEAAINNPDGVVSNVIFPIVSQKKLKAIIQERKAKGEWQRRIFNKIRRSYGGHYRGMSRMAFDALDFQSHNKIHRPVINAIAILRNIPSERRILSHLDKIPIRGVVPPKWAGFVEYQDGAEDDEARGYRIRRIDYEVCVLVSLRQALRSKEIFVEGAERYRDPDWDVPQDFAEARPRYYAELQLQRDASRFTAELMQEMETELQAFNDTRPGDDLVRIVSGSAPKIHVTPLTPAPEPIGLEALGREVTRRWPMTGLIDVLKQCALDTGFLDAFSSSAGRVMLDKDTIERRIMMCLYAYGTNTGLRRVASATSEATYDELLHIRRRFITPEAIRTAATTIASATLAVRDPTIWGAEGTSCASDSKKFGAWDQNLMTEWHARYRGRGVMIYWHVAKRATCIYSQLKKCSSSEVSSMIEGVLRHCTDMKVERHFVDSHGQSEVAFAFCRLLGFELAPRLKAIASQKLHLPHWDLRQSLANISPILRGPIDWEIIERQYDEMVKYAAALRHRTADPEAIMSRFTRTAVIHPTYQALAELGRAIKTIYLCKYLRSEALRREVNEGLNIVENWNSANNFVFYGKAGEISSNRPEEQEAAAFSLHLLQSAMVYVNSRMIQSVIGDPAWQVRLSEEDYRGLTPLIYSHINPYGRVELNMDKQIDFGWKVA